MDGFAACFADLSDPRTGNAARHDMLEMLVIALCSVLTGGEDCTDMAEFAASKFDFLRGFVSSTAGAPRHVQPVVPPARSRPVPRLLPTLHGQLRRSLPRGRRH